MKNTEFTCDTCGVTEGAEGAREWWHVRRKLKDQQVAADHCSTDCLSGWVTRMTAMGSLPLFADGAGDAGTGDEDEDEDEGERDQGRAPDPAGSTTITLGADAAPIIRRAAARLRGAGAADAHGS